MRTRWAAVVVAVLVLGTGCASAERTGRDAGRDSGGDAGADGGAAIGVPRAQADTEATEQPEPEPAPEPRGSEDWRVSRTSFHGELAAYTTRASGVPGTRVGLKVSTTEGGWEAAAFRIGSYEGGTGLFVWESGFRRGRQQSAPRYSSYERRTVVAPWDRDLTVDTSTWTPGFYVFRLRTDTGWETQVPYVVTSRVGRRAPSRWSRPSPRGRPTTSGAATACTPAPTATPRATR